MKYIYILSVPCVVIQFSQFQQTNAHNCHLIHNNILKNTKLIYLTLLFIIYKGECNLIIYKVNNKYWIFYYIFICLYCNIRCNNSFRYTYSVYAEESHPFFHTYNRSKYCLVTILYKTNKVSLMMEYQ